MKMEGTQEKNIEENIRAEMIEIKQIYKKKLKNKKIKEQENDRSRQDVLSMHLSKIIYRRKQLTKKKYRVIIQEIVTEIKVSTC